MVARFIVPALLLPVLMAASPFDAPAEAAAVLSFANAGDSGSFAFSGLKGIDGTEDVAATLSLTLLARTSSYFLLGYSLENDTGGNFDRATITGFGFDIEQPLYAGVSTGEFNRWGQGNVPGLGLRDFCANAGGPTGRCDTSSGAGVRLGEGPGTGTLMLLLSAPSGTIDLSNSFVRWSSVRSKPDDLYVNTAVSEGFLPFEPAPEPATWAMMIAGFGLVGAALRRREKTNRETIDPQ